MPRTLPAAIRLSSWRSRSAHAEPRLVIADQDAMGPGGSDMRALAVFLQSPDVNLPGITVVIGAGWRDEDASTRCACSNCWGERIFAFIRAQPTRPGGRASGVD